IAHEADKVAKDSGIPPLIDISEYLIGVNNFWRGDFKDARAKIERFQAALQQEDHVAYQVATGEDPRISYGSYLSWLLWLLGYPEQANQLSQQTLELAHEIKIAAHTAFGLVF